MQRVSSRSRQRGIGIIGLLFIAIIVGFFLLVGMKVFPTTMEYVAIKRAVAKSISAGNTARDIQLSFDRSAAIDDITSITGKDLVINKDGPKTVVSFAYEKKVPLVGPASLLIEYKGSSN